jgi:hypothetical protein
LHRRRLGFPTQQATIRRKSGKQSLATWSPRECQSALSFWFSSRLISSQEICDKLRVILPGQILKIGNGSPPNSRQSRAGMRRNLQDNNSYKSHIPGRLIQICNGLFGTSKNDKIQIRNLNITDRKPRPRFCRY